MADVTPHDNKFREELGGFFYDALRAAGMTMLPGNFPERVRDVGVRMASVIERAAERKAIQVIKQLQDAVVDAFTKTEAEISALKALVAKQQSLLEEYQQTFDRIQKRGKAQGAQLSPEEAKAVRERLFPGAVDLADGNLGPQSDGTNEYSYKVTVVAAEE